MIGAVVFCLLLNAVAFAFAAALVLWVRPRWLGLTLGFTPLALMGLVMGSLLFTVKAGYGIASSMWDLWPALPSVVALLLLPFVPTRPARIPPGWCECGYDLRGNSSGVCPECGKAVLNAAADKPVC